MFSAKKNQSVSLAYDTVEDVFLCSVCKQASNANFYPSVLTLEKAFDM